MSGIKHNNRLCEQRFGAAGLTAKKSNSQDNKLIELINVDLSKTHNYITTAAKSITYTFIIFK